MENELRELLRDGRKLMAKIGDALDKPKGVIARPGMVVVCEDGICKGDKYFVISRRAYERRISGFDLLISRSTNGDIMGVLVVGISEHNFGHCYELSSEKRHTHNGVTVIGYVDDADDESAIRA